MTEHPTQIDNMLATINAYVGSKGKVEPANLTELAEMPKYLQLFNPDQLTLELLVKAMDARMQLIMPLLSTVPERIQATHIKFITIGYSPKQEYEKLQGFKSITTYNTDEYWQLLSSAGKTYQIALHLTLFVSGTIYDKPELIALAEEFFAGDELKRNGWDLDSYRNHLLYAGEKAEHLLSSWCLYHLDTIDAHLDKLIAEMAERN